MRKCVKRILEGLAKQERGRPLRKGVSVPWLVMTLIFLGVSFVQRFIVGWNVYCSQCKSTFEPCCIHTAFLHKNCILATHTAFLHNLHSCIHTAFLHTFIHIYTYTQTHACMVHTYACMGNYVCVCTGIHTHNTQKYTAHTPWHTHTHTRFLIYTLNSLYRHVQKGDCVTPVSALMLVWAGGDDEAQCIHIPRYIHVHPCIHPCIHPYIHACMHACMHA